MLGHLRFSSGIDVRVDTAALLTESGFKMGVASFDFSTTKAVNMLDGFSVEDIVFCFISPTNKTEEEIPSFVKALESSTSDVDHGVADFSGNALKELGIRMLGVCSWRRSSNLLVS